VEVRTRFGKNRTLSKELKASAGAHPRRGRQHRYPDRDRAGVTHDYAYTHDNVVRLTRVPRFGYPRKTRKDLGKAKRLICTGRFWAWVAAR